MPALSRSAVAATDHMSKSRMFPAQPADTDEPRQSAGPDIHGRGLFSEHMVTCWRVTANPHNGIRPVPGRFLEGFSFRPATVGDWGRLG